jgi:hypothetical protein
MNPEKAKELIVDTAWHFMLPQDVEAETRPKILYKYQCFDGLIGLALHPLLTATKHVSPADREMLLPQGVILLNQLVEMRTALTGADGKVKRKVQRLRDGSIGLVDNLLSTLLEDWKLDRYFESDGSVKRA